MIDSEKLVEVARAELAFLWRDLEAAIRAAVDGVWSARCEAVVERIKMLTPVVGPTPWRQVPLILVETRLYQEIHAAIGIEAEVKAWQIAEEQALMEAMRGA
ncbi:hypothetical protein [Streptomyces erythrochromogenes]|uniref:hypothetical protein n=1 Tax=Streptomyces erythrochromogenes TaxID=285574 RepID=UPI002257C0F0|nr:hypothetical protein [Streptomyces erythrochromogenes]MCX5584298.1 hypothetical protein [Streptomyces erythrochromogenes]